MAGRTGHDEKCCQHRDHSSVNVVGVDLVADLSGALFWEEQSCWWSPICISKRLQLCRARRAAAALRYSGDARPPRGGDRAARSRMVIALGDSFHDRAPMTGCRRRTVTPSRRSKCGATGSGYRQSRSGTAADLGGVVAAKWDRPIVFVTTTGAAVRSPSSASEGAVSTAAARWSGDVLPAMRARRDAGVRRYTGG